MPRSLDPPESPPYAAIFKLRDAGHSIPIIEHHPDVVATADHLIQRGTGGGKNGGKLP